MKINTATVNKKDTLRVYHAQCDFFGFSPKDSFTLEKMSAREVYALCEHDFNNQSKSMKRKYINHLRGKKSLWDRIFKRRVIRTVSNARRQKSRYRFDDMSRQERKKKFKEEWEGKWKAPKPAIGPNREMRRANANH